MRLNFQFVMLGYVLSGLCFLRAASAGVTTQPAPVIQIALTADTEGHLDACRSCPGPIGLGGLSRRGTVVQGLRAAGPLLLLDGGNAVFGDQSTATRGQAVVAAYDAMGYDVINVSYRDFRYGKDEAVKLFGTAKASVVSANLLDATTGKTLFQPYVVKAVGGRRFAVIGLTDAPGDLDLLPHLKRQLAGLRVDPLDTALAKWLPAARAESDSVILLFYGSPAALTGLDADRLRQCLLILLGDARPDDLPAGFAAAGRYAGEQHGRSITVITLGGPTTESRQIPLDQTIPADEGVDAILAKYRLPRPDRSRATSPADQ